jgi:hypothetical protein
LNLLQRIAGAIVAVLLLAAALVFASVLLAVAGVVALAVWAWLWWHTRDARRAAAKSEATVIEGEYRVERETRRLDDRD